MCKTCSYKLKEKHSGVDFEDLLWVAADYYYPVAFARNMEELKKLSPAAYSDWKLSIFCHWSRYVVLLI